mmetsp:Transcript_115659/g.248503  ORF Transcript_115659/g.248503 Transcript_115659/m.248503 type:complete len:286 (+) Transcript_115659:2-859(+)
MAAAWGKAEAMDIGGVVCGASGQIASCDRASTESRRLSENTWWASVSCSTMPMGSTGFRRGRAKSLLSTSQQGLPSAPKPPLTSILRTTMTSPFEGSLVISTKAFSSRSSMCQSSRQRIFWFSRACCIAPLRPGTTCWRIVPVTLLNWFSASWLSSVLNSQSSTPDVLSTTCLDTCRCFTTRANSGGDCGETSLVLMMVISVSKATLGRVRLTCDRMGPRPARASSRGLPRTMRSSVSASLMLPPHKPSHPRKTLSWMSAELALVHIWHCSERLAHTAMIVLKTL